MTNDWPEGCRCVITAEGGPRYVPAGSGGCRAHPDATELEPYDLTAEPKARITLQPGWAERFKELTPLKPFAGPPAVSGEFTIEAYPGAIERLIEMTRNHPNYCATCEGFPCRGTH